MSPGVSTTGTIAAPVDFVDAHQHFQDLDANLYPWLADVNAPRKLEGDLQPLRRNYLMPDYRADLSGMRLLKSVHVQNGWDPGDPVGETRWLQNHAETTGFPHAIVAFADLANDRVGAVLEQHARCANVRGIREILNWSDDPILNVARRSDLMSDAAWRRGFGLLRTLDFSFDLQIYWWQMDAAYDLARAFPDTAIVLNHFGMPVQRSVDGIASWSSAMARLAHAPNVSVKLSGFGLGRRGWTTVDTGPLLLRTIDLFGVDRCLCGSNLPFDRLYAPPSQIVAALHWLATKLGAVDADKVLRANATRIYRI